MRPILVGRHPAVTHFEHVRIVPMTRLRIAGDIDLGKPDALHGIPAVGDVGRSAPEVASRFRSPLPHIGGAVLAQAIDHGASGTQQGFTHFLIGAPLFFAGRSVDATGATPVVFQVIIAPVGERPGILLLVSVAALVSAAHFPAARLRPRRGVDPDLQAFGVDIAGQRFHVRELRVGGDVALGVAP